MSERMSGRPRTAVVTPVHGRHDHLAGVQHTLSAGAADERPDHWVVVAMADETVARWRPDGLRPDVVEVGTGPDGGLPLAAARNAGARRAVALGAEVLVFLDVDCLAGPGLVEAYRDAAASRAGRVWCGPVTYLPPAGPAGYDLDPTALAALDAPHPARPAPAPGTVVDSEAWELFWSLSFAIRADDLARVGGFCERYVGYGAEDTDFAQLAREAGLGLSWLGAARAYHQHHPVSDPPVERVDDVVRNATLFRERWGWWPMGGWLEAFEARGLVRRTADGGWAR